MNIIHYMHDKYYYEKAQMALVDTNPRINLAYGVAGLSIALDSLSAIKYAKVTARRNDIGLTEGFDIQGEFPCFGNDNDKVDHLGVDLVYFFSEELKKLPVYKKCPSYSVFAHHHSQRDVWQEKPRCYSRRTRQRVSLLLREPTRCTDVTRTVPSPL